MSKSKSAPLTSKALSRLGSLFGRPPLLTGERAEEYNELVTNVFGAVKPIDVIEEIWVKDLVDLVWELLRLRRFKTSLLKASAHDGLKNLLRLSLEYTGASELAEQWAAHDPDAIKEVKEVLKSSQWTMDDVMAQTFDLKMDDIERIDRMIMMLETRRNATLREIDRHRAALGEKLRQVTQDIEDAEYEVIEPDGKKQQSAA